MEATIAIMDNAKLLAVTQRIVRTVKNVHQAYVSCRVLVTVNAQPVKLVSMALVQLVVDQIKIAVILKLVSAINVKILVSLKELVDPTQIVSLNLMSLPVVVPNSLKATQHQLKVVSEYQLFVPIIVNVRPDTSAITTNAIIHALTQTIALLESVATKACVLKFVTPTITACLAKFVTIKALVNLAVILT